MSQAPSILIILPFVSKADQETRMEGRWNRPLWPINRFFTWWHLRGVECCTLFSLFSGGVPWLEYLGYFQ